MTAIIVLTTAGTDTGPFDLRSNVDGYVTPFELGVSKAQLEVGFSSDNIPFGTTIIRVVSTGACTNYTDIPIVIPCTTYRYDYTIYNCGTCEAVDAGTIDNGQELTVGKFYYSDFFGAVVGIDFFDGPCTADVNPIYINGTFPFDTCAAVVCP